MPNFTLSIYILIKGTKELNRPLFSTITIVKHHYITTDNEPISTFQNIC